MADRETTALLNAIDQWEQTHQKAQGFQRIQQHLQAVKTEVASAPTHEQSPGQQASGAPPSSPVPSSPSPGQQAAGHDMSTSQTSPTQHLNPSPGQQAAGGAMPGGLIEYLKRKKQMAGG